MTSLCLCPIFFHIPLSSLPWHFKSTLRESVPSFEKESSVSVPFLTEEHTLSPPSSNDGVKIEFTRSDSRFSLLQGVVITPISIPPSLITNSLLPFLQHVCYSLSPPIYLKFMIPEEAPPIFYCQSSSTRDIFEVAVFQVIEPLPASQLLRLFLTEPFPVHLLEVPPPPPPSSAPVAGTPLCDGFPSPCSVREPRFSPRVLKSVFLVRSLTWCCA